MNMASLALRNLKRNKTRTILTAVGVAAAILLFVSLRTVIDAWEVAVNYAAQDRIGTRHRVSFVIPMPRRYIDMVRQVPGVEQATFANWFGGKDPRDDDNFFQTLAVDPESFLEVYNELEVPADQRQRWLEDRQGALLGDVLARKLEVAVGDRVTIAGTIFPGDHTFNVDGIYVPSRRSFDRSSLLFHWDYLNELPANQQRDQIGWMVSRVTNANDAALASRRIDQVFDVQDIQTLSMSERAMNTSFMGMFSAMFTAINWISLIILGILLLILGNTVAMGVRERTNEYGVLRAIGFLPRHIEIFILSEAAMLGLLAGLLGVGLAYPIVEQGIGRFLEENMGGMFPYFRIAPGTAVGAVVLALVLGVIAAGVPAYRASKLTVTDALRRLD